MGKIIYETTDKTFLGIIEQVFQDNNINYSITGASDVGLALNSLIQITVSEDQVSQAEELLKQIIE